MAPLLGVGLFIAIGHWLQARDAGLKAQGAQKCDAEWQLLAIKAERDQHKQSLQRERSLLETERGNSKELADELAKVRTAFEEHRNAASSDPRCISDGVLDLLRKHGSVR